MRTNAAARRDIKTHEGGQAGHSKPADALLRAVSTCLLFESTFYEKGSEVAANIESLCAQVTAEELASIAVEARQRLNLRHVPLFLVRQLAKLHRGTIVGDTLAAVLRRPDEATEFLALWWKDGREATAKLSAQVKRGLRLAFSGWDEYRLAKYSGAGDKIKLRDALFLCHAKPRLVERPCPFCRVHRDAGYQPTTCEDCCGSGVIREDQAALWKRLINGELLPPDTWEVALSAGTDKKVTWERLLSEKKLGYQALLMNLRNMIAAGVDAGVVRDAIRNGKKDQSFPFRFMSAARYAPQFADVLSEAMLASLEGLERMPGSTAVLVDVSGSMDDKLSAKGEMTRLDAASCLAVILREIGETVRVFTFSQNLVEVLNHRGLPLADLISKSQEHGGTYLRGALDKLKSEVPSVSRVIVVTDEQSHDGIASAWAQHSYLINVAPYKPGLDVSHGWKRINGWSDRVVDWMMMEERATQYAA